MNEKEKFESDLIHFINTLKGYVSTDDGQWTVKGFIDIFRNVYTISSKILEIHLFPKILKFAENNCYKLVLAEHQNYYPDISFIKADDESVKFAVDFKTTYRKAEKPELCNGFTLGSHGEYFKNRTSTKNIQFPYSAYKGHFCLGIIYERSDGASIDETKSYDIGELHSIVSVVKNFQFFVAEKWKIASDKGGSGNTANIGSINNISDILNQKGMFLSSFRNERQRKTELRRILMNKISVPPIKCQGIKTKLVPWIKAIVPDNFNGKWIEPFMGSGVVAFNVRPEKAVLCDTNPHLIEFYNSIKTGKITSDLVSNFLKTEGKKLKQKGEDYYYEVRERFNHNNDPLDFLFLNRSCFNGMIRFNQKGGFNVPFCRKPQRFEQAYVTKIVNQVSYVQSLLNYYDYEFKCQDFEITVQNAAKNDIVYCDPPYIDRHADYYNGWDEKHEIRLNELLKKSDSKFILSTWHSNDYRENTYLTTIWCNFNILTREHFYHVGGFEKNRNPMLEALVTNFKAVFDEQPVDKAEQLTLFEKLAA